MASRFRFVGQMLLKLRKQRQDVARQGLYHASGQVSAIENRLDRLREAMEAHSQALHEMIQAGADAIDVSLYQQCISDIRKAIKAELARLETASASSRRHQDELIDASRQYKATQALKDRQMRSHAAADRQAEASRQDDLHAAGRAMEMLNETREAF